MDIVSERTIALAGIIQACAGVQSLAREGKIDSSSYEPCIKSILVLDAVNTPRDIRRLGWIKTRLSTNC